MAKTNILTIVIVTYNSSKYIKKCLDSIKRYKVIIVDNNSNDNTLDIVKRYKLKLIRNKRNFGYAKAANLGIKASDSKYVLLINPDIYFKKDSINKMIDFMQKNHSCDIQGPKLLDMKDRLIYSCKRFPTFKAMIGRRLGIFEKDVDSYLMKDYDHKNSRRVDWVSGGCIIFRKGLKLDPGYFLYFEDVDFCVGKKVFYNPNVIVYHTVQRDSAKKFKFLIIHLWSMLRYIIKYYFSQ